MSPPIDVGSPHCLPHYGVDSHFVSKTVIEANKFAYGQRSNFGDPAFTPNVTTLERLYLTEPVVEAARAKINDTATFGTSFYTPSGYVPGPEAGTSHLAVVDGDGMAVSLTT
jgi:gamma-glutamyltranspeptidase/glutathione hydrolase